MIPLFFTRVVCLLQPFCIFQIMAPPGLRRFSLDFRYRKFKLNEAVRRCINYKFETIRTAFLTQEIIGGKFSYQLFIKSYQLPLCTLEFPFDFRIVVS